MRGLKEFFCKIVAAVICFGMKVFSGSIFENILKEMRNLSENRRKQKYMETIRADRQRVY